MRPRGDLCQTSTPAIAAATTALTVTPDMFTEIGSIAKLVKENKRLGDCVLSHDVKIQKLEDRLELE